MKGVITYLEIGNFRIIRETNPLIDAPEPYPDNYCLYSFATKATDKFGTQYWKHHGYGDQDINDLLMAIWDPVSES